MKDFGIFSISPEMVTVGDKERQVYFLRNGEGQDLVDVLKAFVHPYYIAVAPSGHIISMESDPEAIQIPDHTIIGIDSTYGYTRGAGGTVYGMMWNGGEIVEPMIVPDDPDFDFG